MVCIGIVGDENFQTIEMLMRLLKKERKSAIFIDFTKEGTDLNVFLKKYNKNDFVVLGLYQNFTDSIPDDVLFDILVYLKGDKMNHAAKHLSEKNTVVINCDEKSIFPLSIGIGTTLVTSGLNSKATVTASSIDEYEDNLKIQICLQRSIETVTKKEIVPQEFSVEVLKKNDPSDVLAVATVAMLCDITVENIKINC